MKKILLSFNCRYSPVLERILTRDPIGIAGGDVNWYCYCGNDPVNFVDGLLRFVQGTFFGQRILK